MELRSSLLLAGALMIGVAATANGQSARAEPFALVERREPLPAPFVVGPATMPTKPDLRLRAEAGDYRWEGLIGGAVAGAIGGAVLANGFCNDSEDPDHSCGLATVGGAAIGALISGVVFGLIGSAIDK